MFVRFALTWLIIIGMASFDTYLTVKHSPVMEEVELNPLGHLVLRSQGGVPLFVGMKTGGVALALLASFALWQKEQLRPKVLLSTYSVAALGLAVICFMSIDVVGMQAERMAKAKPSTTAVPLRRVPPPSSVAADAIEPRNAEVERANRTAHEPQRVAASEASEDGTGATGT
jgi:hypothetical protein